MRYYSSGYWMVVILVIFLITGCDRLSVKDSLDDVRYELLDHRDEQIVFPETYKGKILLVGYVYTHCPDICPMITHNMRDVERKLDDDEIHFISISFDPDRDSPEVLADYASHFRLDEDRWSLLTGERSSVHSLLERLEIATVKTPTRFTDSGDAVYFIDHTDRVSLVDKDGKIRRHYYGSELDAETVVEDIKNLRLKE